MEFLFQKLHVYQRSLDLVEVSRNGNAIPDTEGNHSAYANGLSKDL